MIFYEWKQNNVYWYWHCVFSCFALVCLRMSRKYVLLEKRQVATNAGNLIKKKCKNESALSPGTCFKYNQEKVTKSKWQQNRRQPWLSKMRDIWFDDIAKTKEYFRLIFIVLEIWRNKNRTTHKWDEIKSINVNGRFFVAMLCYMMLLVLLNVEEYCCVL